jgi:hypothetical protein
MAITLGTELEQARAVLAARTATELVDFILSLAFAPDGVCEYVHAFVLAADTKAAAEVLSRELGFMRHGERGGDHRFRNAARHVARANRWLVAVERCVLPRDPQTALRLLTAFIESNEQISEHCWDDDFGTSQLFARALTMAENLATTLPACRACQPGARAFAWRRGVLRQSR